MSVSQNGWPVVGRDMVDNWELHGVNFPNGTLKGDVTIVAKWFVEEFHRTVEPLHIGWCWGWYVKPIEGTGTISNHSSGTAWDINAPDHQMGASHSGFNTRQEKTIDTLLKKSDGCIRWGWHYSGRKDPMHFEIVRGRAAVSILADKITGGPTRMHKYVKLDGYTYPTLFLGDDDDDFVGPRMVTKVQKLLGVTVDGIYGPQVKAAVAALPTEGSGSSIGLVQWEAIIGLSTRAAE